MKTICIKINEKSNHVLFIQEKLIKLSSYKHIPYHEFKELISEDTVIIIYDPFELQNDHLPDIENEILNINKKIDNPFSAIDLGDNDDDKLKLYQTLIELKLDLPLYFFELLFVYLQLEHDKVKVPIDLVIKKIKELEVDQVSYNDSLISELKIITIQSHPAFIKLSNKNKYGTSFYSLYQDNIKLTKSRHNLEHLLRHPITCIPLINQRLDTIETLNLLTLAEKRTIDTNLSKYSPFKTIFPKLNSGKFEISDFAKFYKNLNTAKLLLHIYFTNMKLDIIHFGYKEIITELEAYKEMIEGVIDLSNGSEIKYGVSEDYDQLKKIQQEMEYYFEYLEDEEKSELRKLSINFEDLRIISVPELGYMISIVIDQLDNGKTISDQKSADSGLAELFPDEYKYLFNKGNIYFLKNDVTAKLDEEIGDLRGRLFEIEKLICIDLEKKIISKEAFFSLVDGIIFKIDCFNGLSKATVQYGFKRPDLIETESSVFIAKEIFNIFCRIIDERSIPHDFISVSSDISKSIFDKDEELYKPINFITGPNGSGKSIFLQTLGSIPYLAQCGLFVPCERFISNVFTEMFFLSNFEETLKKQVSTLKISLDEFNGVLDKLTNKSLLICDEFFNTTNKTFNSSFLLTVIDYFNHKYLESPEGIERKLPFVFLSSHNLQLLNSVDETQYSFLQFLTMKTVIKINKIIFDTVNDYDELKQQILSYIDMSSTQRQGMEIHYLYKLEKGKSKRSFGAFLLLKEGLQNHELFFKLLKMENEEHALAMKKEIENNVLEKLKRSMGCFKEMLTSQI